MNKKIILLLLLLTSCTNHIFISTSYYVGGTLPQLPDTWTEILYNEELNKKDNYVFLGGYKGALSFEIDTTIVQHKIEKTEKGTTIYFHITEKGKLYNLFKVIVKGENFRLCCLFKNCIYTFSKPNERVTFSTNNKDICIDHNGFGGSVSGGIGYNLDCLILYKEDLHKKWLRLDSFDCTYYAEPFCFSTKNLEKGNYKLILNGRVPYFFDIK